MINTKACGCLACVLCRLQVAPKRAALAAAQESLDKTLAELASAQARLAAVQEKIATLEAQYEEATAKKATLAAQVRVARVIHLA
jgi:dynein heavy chain